MRRAAAIVLAAIAAAFLTAPSPAADRHPWTIPHELRYATGEDITTLNPHLSAQVILSYMSSLTMAWLVKYDARNRPVPELATEVPSRTNGGISADGRTITYHLRHDARWSDGVPFSADDVRFSADVVRNPENNEFTHEGFDLIEKIDTPDRYTVRVHLSRPHSGFIVNFFGSAYNQPCVLPAHLLAGSKTINDVPYNALPVGIGPFKYAAWHRGDNVELVPDPLYFGRKPKLQRVVFKIITDRNTMLTQLASHGIDLWLPVPAAYVDRVTALPGVRVVHQGSYLYNHIDFEVEHGALRDPVVRRALRLATDRAAILAKIAHGVGILTESVLPPSHPFHADIPFARYDPAAANRMLDAAGWRRGPDGVRAKGSDRLEFLYVTASGTPDTDAQIELIRTNWETIGARFEVKHYLSTQLFGSMQSGGILRSAKYDVSNYAWVNSPNGDLTNLFACDRIPPRGNNIPRYCDREVDAALARFEAGYDERVQRDALRVVQERLARDVPTLVLNARQDVYAFNDDLQGFHPNQVTPFDDLVDADI